MKRFGTTAVLIASALLLGGISQMTAAETVQLSKDQVKELIGSAKTAGDHQKLYNPPRQRQIGHASQIPAMDTPRKSRMMDTSRHFRTPGPR